MQDVILWVVSNIYELFIGDIKYKTATLK